MRQTAKVLCKLLTDGELGHESGTLIADYRTPEVRRELDVWGEEMGFTLVEMRGKVYLIPNSDSDLLSFTMRDIRETESAAGRMIDAFLQCYITMTILWLLYGGKNNNPKRVLFLQLKDIVEALDDRFRRFTDTDIQRLETEYEINFQQIADHWGSLLIEDDHKRKTRIGAVLRACRLLERERLLRLLDEDREIRPTDRLDDLMIGYYLDMHRVGELHELFDSLEESGNAKAE